MNFTVLGKYGPYPKKNGATTSYLIDCGEKILLDCGSGALSRLQNFCSFEDLDKIILTHLHSDHFSDMLVLRYAKHTKIPVYLPKTPETEHAFVSRCDKFETTNIEQNLMINEENVCITFCRTVHPVECFAVKIRTAEKTFVFTGDAQKTDELTAFCSGADALVIDSGIFGEKKEEKQYPHMFLFEAAQTAKEANVKKLWLSHINPTYDENAMLAAAREIFENSEIVEEMRTYEV